MEGEICQGLQSIVPHCRMQTQARLSRLPQGRCGTCETRRGWLLASQVPRHVRYAMPMGWRRFAHGAAVARSLRYGIDDAVFEAVTESAREGQGERDFCLSA